MKKIMLPLSALLTLGCFLLAGSARAQWIADSPMPVAGHHFETKTNADGSLSSSPFQASTGYDITAAPLDTVQATGREAEQWKQTYTWQGTVSPWNFSVGASASVSGAGDEGGYGNNYTSVSSDAIISLNGSYAYLEIGGQTPYTSGGSYDKSSGGTTFNFSSSVDESNTCTSYLLINLDAHAAGQANNGYSIGHSRASVTLGAASP